MVDRLDKNVFTKYKYSLASNVILNVLLCKKNYAYLLSVIPV